MQSPLGVGEKPGAPARQRQAALEGAYGLREIFLFFAEQGNRPFELGRRGLVVHAGDVVGGGHDASLVAPGAADGRWSSSARAIRSMMIIRNLPESAPLKVLASLIDSLIAAFSGPLG